MSTDESDTTTRRDTRHPAPAGQGRTAPHVDVDVDDADGQELGRLRLVDGALRENAQAEPAEPARKLARDMAPCTPQARPRAEVEIEYTEEFESWWNRLTEKEQDRKALLEPDPRSTRRR